MSWATKWRWDTSYNADSVEWCPVEPYCDVLVCGTYQLEKKDEDQQTKQKRLGRIYLFVINQETTELSPIQCIDTAGILDQKWCYHTIQDVPVLAVVTSEGFLQLYQLVEEAGLLRLKVWIDVLIGQDLLALSLDWSSNKTKMAEPYIVVSDSSGSISVWKVVTDGLEKIGSWNSHGFEAWIGAFNYWNPNVVYSGGDDCAFKSYDVRVESVVSTNRSHEAGVTAIRSHVDVEHQLLTGSYDEKIRLWDTRQLKRCITEKAVNGGVWRLKWHPFDTSGILAACMYGGFRTIRLEEDLSIISEYLEHESIAYGADWKYDEKLSLVATCSFYDCKMHVSEVRL